MDVIAKFFRDNAGRVVIWQAPNVPLIGWAVFAALAHVVPDGRWQIAAGYISFGFIFTWAWLEITSGRSHFRRVLGVVVLAASIHARLT